MNITTNAVVSLAYELREGDGSGEVIETTTPTDPMMFIYGTGSMLEDFETNISGKTAGDKCDFGIVSDKAYGAHNADAVVDVPKNIFEVDGKMQEELLEKGTPINMQDPEGNPLMGIVQEVKGDIVTMDFNHPMAGKDLHFKVEILEVREATADEIDHGHVHGPGGHNH